MAKSRRVQVVLTDEAFLVLEKIKKYQGGSLSGIVGGFVHTALPELSRAADMLEMSSKALETGNTAYLDELKRSLGEQVMGAGLALSDLEKILDASEKDSEA